MTLPDRKDAIRRVMSRDFRGIRMDVTIKDLELETQTAKTFGMPLFMAVAHQVYSMANARGGSRCNLVRPA